jgi:hypothetical protein
LTGVLPESFFILADPTPLSLTSLILLCLDPNPLLSPLFLEFVLLFVFPGVLNGDSNFLFVSLKGELCPAGTISGRVPASPNTHTMPYQKRVEISE